MGFLYPIFYVCLRLRFLDVETNNGPRRPVPTVCRLLCSNEPGLAGNLSDLTVASPRYGMLLCSETLVSDMRHVSEFLVVAFSRPVLLCQGRMPLVRGMAAYVRDGYGAFRQPKFECGCCEMLVFRVCGARQNLYVFSLYRNPDVDDRMFDCLLTSMAAVQAEHVRASLFHVCGWFEWPSSGVVGFYNHKSSWCCSLWLRNCVWLWSVGCRNDPCTWLNTWPPDRLLL